MSDTIWTMLRANCSQRAIGAPGDRGWMTGARLHELAVDVRTTLAAAGIGPVDCVAMILPNGPEMAAAFLAVAASCCAAPLNPTYTRAELEFFFSDLHPAAVLVAAGAEGPAREVAEAAGIPILTLRALPGPAGAFLLESGMVPTATSIREVRSEDVALVLHTSGTTARPKMVPLSNANILASARHITASLALGPSDICLNIMPLFHIHGLIAAVTASIYAGAGVCCTAGFNALSFGELLAEVRPTWFTGVPTMHQAILNRLNAYPEQARTAPLRFIRSSSASLASRVMAELETVFGVPVIEAYGMTEAAHQMAANPLSPGIRKPGTVGIPSGPEIGIIDDHSELLPRGSSGEVVIRGPNVMAGYAGNPAANADAFTAGGWFRTGDQGSLDDEGYLTLTGRLKEQINRGGEKISPLEIDVVLLDYPGIAQACTFAILHGSLGEEVCAVVVPRAGATLIEAEVREFAATRLAPFKVPRRILIRDSIPLGATGKVQRIGMASKLGLVQTG